MPRKPRFYLPGYPVHIVQRGHNQDKVFFAKEDYLAYLDWLQEGSEWYEVPIHAYVLLPNRIHILCSPPDKEAASRMMQYQGRRYVPYVNATYGMTGTLWQGRYKASLIDPDTWLLPTMVYIETQSIRSGLGKSAGAWKWSSYHHNARGKTDPLITRQEHYLALARSGRKRLEKYDALVKAGVSPQQIRDIEDAWQTGTPIGPDSFKRMVERRLKLKVGHPRRGRPRKTA